MTSTIYFLSQTILLFSCILTHSKADIFSSYQAHIPLLSLKGGLVPQASDGGKDYYEQFALDYGNEDNIRNAGALRGFLKSGSVKSLPESDPFLKWLNDHLEKGPQPLSGRVKPFYVCFSSYFL
jgi:hypothetical protein